MYPSYLVSLALCLVATTASSAVLDFDSAAPGEYLTAPYLEDGFRLDVLEGHYDIWTCGVTDPCTGNHLGVDANFGAASRVRLTQANGGAFNLYSLLVVSSGFSPHCALDKCTVTSSNGGFRPFQTSGTTMTFSGPEWTNLYWVEFFTDGPREMYIGEGVADIDDINVAAVPVPAGAWLFGSALGALGWVRRRCGRS